MSPTKSCPKRVHYRTVWLGLLIIGTIMAVLTLGFSSLAVHLPNANPVVESRSNAISRLVGSPRALPGVHPASPTAGSVIVIDSAPNMSLEALPDPGYFAAALAPAPPKPQAANLDQIRNGSAASRTDPGDWVNGNAGGSTAHYREGYSIPYRLVLTNLVAGPHNVKIEWDIRNNSKNAIDYITHFNRLNNPNHNAVFGHAAEVIDPTGAAPGSDPSDLIAGLGVPLATAIPTPSSAGSTVAGQPGISFAAVPAAERTMTSYNATGVVLSYDSEGSLSASNSSTSLNINFTGSGTVVLAWGGHIASGQDWPGASASNVSGSPYHTRLISLDGSGGNQDRSLAASAVIVDCATCSVGAATTAECGTQKTHTATISAASNTVCDTPQHSWSFASNTSGATFAGSTTGSSVTVNVGNACSGSYTVRDTITCSGCTSGSTIFCDQTVTVSDTTPPVIGAAGANVTISCPSTPAFTAPTATDNCSTPTVGVVSDSTTAGSCAGTYSRTVTWKATDACGNQSTPVSQTITVVDTTAPTIGAAGANATIQCPNSPSFTPPTASDTCGGATVQQVSDVTTAGTCANTFSETKTWKAVDACGNPSGNVTQTITVVDTTKPSLTCPPDVTVDCKTDVPAAATTLAELVAQGGSASDTCGSVTISSEDSEPFDTSSCGVACGGKITRTYTATDGCGNSSTCTQTITYGTPGSAQTAQQVLIASLLKSGDLIVGFSGTNSLTIPGGLNAKSSAYCLVRKLSASGSASELADFGDRRLDPATCQTSPSLELQEDGTWRNVVLSQAISLALNLRLSTQQEQLRQEAKGNGLAAILQVGRPDADFDLGSFALTSTLSTQGALPGPDGLRGTFDDELDLSSARLQLTIPAAVLTALGPNATAADLLRLANAELAGVSTSDVKLSDIAAALDAVNRSFDFGKRRLVLNK
jgi:hypothetical protein